MQKKNQRKADKEEGSEIELEDDEDNDEDDDSEGMDSEEAKR